MRDAQRSVPAPTERVKYGGAKARILRERGHDSDPAPATSESVWLDGIKSGPFQRTLAARRGRS